MCHCGKPSFICLKKERRTLWLCTVYRELNKITIKTSALYFEEMIYGINCQQQISFPGMIWGPDITPKPCNHSLSFVRMPFYSNSYDCCLSHLQILILSNIVYYLIFFNLPYISTRYFLLAWSSMSFHVTPQIKHVSLLLFSLITHSIVIW